MGLSPHERAELCICLNLRMASRAVTQYYDAQLRPSGIKATQLPVLTLAEANGPMTMSHLADELVMERTTLTRNLKPLQRRGLIRIEEGEDRRARLVVLTEAGRKAMARAAPLWQRAQARMVRGLGRKRFGELLQELGATVAVAAER
ncbi:MAG: MarR family winged helix-turn-helix transcriptional regulator [Acidobacteriota bacterium]